MTLRAVPIALLALAVTAPVAAAAPPPLPSNWPSKRLEIGLADQPGGALALKKKARPKFRYQYLAGGYNTGNGWQTWNENGSFVSMYIEESKKAKQIPVFTYYQVNSSQPGAGSGESDVVKTNLQSGSSVKDLFDDLKVFYERAKSAGGPVVLHVEPDLWGYIQQSVNGSDDAKDYEVNLSGAGLSDLDGLPNNAAGFAQAIVRLRDRYAPNVVLGYHVSIWGTGTDITLQDPSNGEVDRLAAKASNFYKSLGAGFDVTFGEFDDRDSGFNEAINGDGGASWFKKADYTRHARFFRGYSRASAQRIVLWQIPLGNTLMRAMNNQWGHYQDNKVQTVLGGSTGWLRRYRDAGVIAFLFGGGADGTTCACDATNDGKTNPSPINGNKRRSLSADDDGGYWASRTKAYYRRGALKLPR
jgi:hypothetical protein